MCLIEIDIEEEKVVLPSLSEQLIRFYDQPLALQPWILPHQGGEVRLRGDEHQLPLEAEGSIRILGQSLRNEALGVVFTYPFLCHQSFTLF